MLAITCCLASSVAEDGWAPRAGRPATHSIWPTSLQTWALSLCSIGLAMAFSKADNVNISKGVVNDVGKNQYMNYIFPLAPFESAAGISSMVQQVKSSGEQLQVMATSINTLLGTLDSECCVGQLLEANTSFALDYVRHGILTPR